MSTGTDPSSSSSDPKASRAVRLPGIDADTSTTLEKVLVKVVENVKRGPFKATSGVEVPYYLNALTNMLDWTVATSIVQLMIQYIEHSFGHLKADIVSGKQSRIVLLGMEAAGGVMASQMASYPNSPLNSWMDFVYVRKEKKKTGTAQQLEGPMQYTGRTSAMPNTVRAIAVDDALSTGSSLKTLRSLLANEYSMELIGAVYLVDRHTDRLLLPDERQHLASKELANVNVVSIFDISDVESRLSLK